MALTWRTDAIENYEEVCTTAPDENGDRYLSPITDALIWQTLTTGIGKITEDNWTEFYARMTAAARCGKYALIFEDGEPREITPAEVRAHIGLATNVYPEESRTKWVRRWFGQELDGLKRSASEQAKKVTA